jgi:sn-glycerol 3-phosphate transport system ATP-binding protein
VSTIEIEHISKAFGERQAVSGISFKVAKGDLAVLLGPSGCGKSTTLRLIAGLDSPTRGRVQIDGQDVTDLPSAQRHFAMVFQSYALFPHLSVGENIIFGLKVRKVGRHERDERLKRVADLVGLSPYLERKPNNLSGGQRQRVALSRAIIAEQPICLMDEPLSNLDAQLRHEMRVEIRALQRRLGMTMIYVTHDQTEAMTMADQIILLRDGKVEQIGSPISLYDRPATTFAAKFIGTPAMNLIEESAGTTPERILGVRPEHIVPAPIDSPRADPRTRWRLGRVIASEYLGADTIVTARADNGTSIAARIAGHSPVGLGDPIEIRWQITHEHRFDAHSGRRIDDL